MKEQIQKPSKMKAISNFRYKDAITVDLMLFPTYSTV